MRAIWNGAIGFGLVNIPIKLFPASESSSIDLDMLDGHDFSNIKFKRVNEKTGAEVAFQDIVKGFKMEDRYVVLQKEDFEAVSPEKSKILKIKQFVQHDDIDPALFETPYYAEPQKNGEEAYQLLLKSLTTTKMAGVGTFILREKEILCIVRPYDDKVLMINRMRFPQEMRPYAELKLPTKKTPQKEELEMAKALIKQFTSEFKPGDYVDTYHEELMKIINRKAKGETVAVEEVKEPAGKTTDLMAMLKASLESSTKKAG